MKILNDVKKIFFNKKICTLCNLLWMFFYIGLILGCTFSQFARIFDSSFSLNDFNFRTFKTVESMICCEIALVMSIFFSSFSIFGVFIGLSFVLLKGLGIGLILSQLYIRYLFRGMVFGILFFLPGTFVSLVSIVKLSEKSFKFSLNLSKRIIGHTLENSIFKDTQIYINSAAKLTIVAIFGALVKSCLCSLYLKFFPV